MKGLLSISLCIFLLFSCRQEERNNLFELVPGSKSGITFENTLIKDEHYNLYDYEYFFNGGGVGILDVNNNGLQDVFFGGNTVSCKLYLNQGNFKFKDITEDAGLTTDVWISGIAVVDINRDGWQDLYLSVAGNEKVDDTSNRLYLNNQDNTFTEAAAAYGIDDKALGTQAAFFDYDIDGDLDLYLLNYGNVKWAKERLYHKITDGSGPGADKFYRNNGDGTFTEVTHEAGILVEGYGLGIAILDINQDNYPDIYIANDYLDDDVLYINNQQGGFEDQLAKYVKHTSYFSMGCDAGDINNDGLTDLMVLDMLPEKNERHKTLIGASSYDKVNLRLSEGFFPSYVRNMLQLNTGENSFSEIGRLSGIEATDWSWAPLLADFDNDGYRDLYVTNGYKKEVSNLDILLTINFGSFPMGSEKEIEAFKQEQRRKFLDLIDGLEENKIVNYCFTNNGDLTFRNSNQQWGMDERSLSNGAAYADLDNDGDLDLIVNNIDDPAFVYRNKASEKPDANNYLMIRIEDNQWPAQSTKLAIYYADKQSQFTEYSPFRGYQSSVEDRVHFGLGKNQKVDSLILTWPNGQMKRIENIPVNQTLLVKYEGTQQAKPKASKPKALFAASGDTDLSNFQHKEDHFIDFKNNPLLPHMLSRGGPALVCGDVNGDGQDDLLIGGSKYQPVTLYLQEGEVFRKKEISKPFPFEDMGMALLDFDIDGDLDLYVASGGCENFGGAVDYIDRLYENDGKGNFTLTKGIIPNINTSTTSVSVSDYDRDGDPDIFVGGWVIPDNYPLPEKSFLLRNDNGHFEIVTQEFPDLEKVGLVKSSLWSDIDQDGWEDLIVVGEWMPIRIFKNNNGQLSDATESYGLEKTTGWWNSIQSGDFDNDGDMDYVLGNLGLNTRYEATPEKPATMIAMDIDENGLIDPVIFCYEEDEQYPVHDRDELINRVTSLKKRFFTYQDYAVAGINDFFKPEQQQKAYTKQAQIFESVLLINEENKFRIVPLPLMAQTAPIFGTLALDLNDDSYLDLLVVGNAYNSAISEGPYDALNGLVLFGKGDGTFEVQTKTGFHVPGDGKALAALQSGKSLKIIASQNNDQLRVFDLKETGQVRSTPKEAASAKLFFKDGTQRMVALKNDGGYLSSSSGFFTVPSSIDRILIKNENGEERTIQ